MGGITEMFSESRENLVKIIKDVGDNIEMCLKGYQKKSQVIKFLYVHENTEPRLTEAVWLKLEEEYPAFFKAYYTRLLLMDQILKFNKLLVQQEDLMAKDNSMGTVPVLTSSESHVSPSEQILTPHASQNSSPMEEEEDVDIKLIRVSYTHESSFQPPAHGNVDEFACYRTSFEPNFVSAQRMNDNIVNTDIPRNAGSSHFSPPRVNLYESSPLIDDACFSSLDLSSPGNSYGAIPPIGNARVSCFGNGASNGHYGSKPPGNLYGSPTTICDPGLLSSGNGAFNEYHGSKPPGNLYESTPPNCDPLLSSFENGESDGHHGNNPPGNLYGSKNPIHYPCLSSFGNGASIGHNGNYPPGDNLYESSPLSCDSRMPSTSNGYHGDNAHLFGHASSSGVLPQVPPNVDSLLNSLGLPYGPIDANNNVTNSGDEPSESWRRRYQCHGCNRLN